MMAHLALMKSLPSCTNTRKRNITILVIGAGIAGLAAAQRLRQSGFDVVVLEGRDRIGGRIWTDNSLGLPIDMGAAWIHGVKGNPITKLASEFDAGHVYTDYDSLVAYDFRGKKISDADIEAVQIQFERLFKQAEKLADDEDVDISIGAALDRVIEDATISEDVRHQLNWARSEIALEMAADCSKLSMWSFGDDEEYSGGNHIFKKGYSQIVNGIARDLDIKLKHTVQQIKYSDQKIIITTDRGEFSGDGAVVTLPLGVLKNKDVAFTPALPKQKQKAIDRLGMGVLDKVVLKFPSVFWPKDKDFLEYVSNVPSEFPEFLNLAKSLGEPVLVGLVADGFARSLEKKSDAEIQNLAMTVLKNMFGSSIPNPSMIKVTRWANDAFSHGSYSHLAVGAEGTDYEALSEPVGKALFFAGEATNRKYPATVHGAYLSGIREADRIAALYP